METGKLFSDQETAVLEEIISNRRDVRGNRFLQKDVSDEVLDKLLSAALYAPSVGFSQPWEFVVIRDDATKKKVKASFDVENLKAKDCFEEKKSQEYAVLKLEGITEAPVNIAVFYKPPVAPVLGQTSMKETGLFSVVCAVQNMWLMARALNLGMGWVSILDPLKVKQILNAPEPRQLVAYLCIGWVDKFLTQPELEILKWEKRKERGQVVYYESFQPEGIRENNP
jgi:5,6-dimethylbenzimidazole synthase